MELIKNFEYISETLSTKFPAIKDEVSLYILALFARKYRIGFNFFDLFDTRILDAVEDFCISKITYTELKKEIQNPNIYYQQKRDYDRKICKFLLTTYFNTKSRGIRGSLFPSSNLLRLLLEHASPKSNQVIYDINCGIGNLFVELHKKFPDFNLKLVGYTDNLSGFLCEINLFVNEVNYDYEITSFNALNIKSEIYIENEPDIVITIPPFGKSIDNINFGNSPTSDRPIKNLEIVYIELILAILKDDGKAAVLVPDGFLSFSHPEYVFFRKKYVENDWIEKVISLPQGFSIPNTSIKTSILLLNKNKVERNLVIFDGEDENFEQTIVSNFEIISSGNYDLRANRYALKESKILKNIFAHSNYPIKTIKELASATLGINFSPKQQAKKKSEINLPYVRIKDLSDNEQDSILDISKVEREISVENAYKVINFDAILVSTIGYKLKPTQFKYVNKPIIIGSGIIALRVNEDEIDAKYFLSQLHSKLVQTQVKMLSSGTVINSISKRDFENIQIILPPLEEQKRQIFEMRGVLEAKEQVAEAKEEVENIEYEVIAAISHNLNQKLGSIVEDYDTLLRFLRRKEKRNSTIDFEELLRPLRNGESPENADTFEKVTIRLQNNLLDTTKTLKTTESILQKNKIDAEMTNIISFFKWEIKQSFEGSNFDITIETNLRKIEVNLDKNAFKDAIRNLIENAKRHGFVEENDNYKIIFDINKWIDSNGIEYAQIVYKNNGKPFPKGFTFEEYKRLASRAGKTKNTGIGGFFVNKVIELHNGKFNIISVSEEFSGEFKVQFEILLPLID